MLNVFIQDKYLITSSTVMKQTLKIYIYIITQKTQMPS